MPSRVPTVRYTEARLSSMRTSLSSAGVSWHTPVGYPNYAHHRACALSSPSPFHYVTAKIVPVVQLAAHAKSSTLYGRSYGRTSRFVLIGYYHYIIRIIMGATLRAVRALRAPLLMNLQKQMKTLKFSEMLSCLPLISLSSSISFTVSLSLSLKKNNNCRLAFLPISRYTNGV